MTFDTAPVVHDVLLVGVIRFLVVVVANRNCNPLGVPLLSLLVVIGVLFGILDGDAGWRRSAAAGDRFPTAWDKEGPDRLLIGGVLGDDVEQFLLDAFTPVS
jgi:hypothetical protein